MVHHKASTTSGVSVISIMVLALVLVGCGSTDSNGGGGTLFQSALLSPGETFSYTFDEEGNFPYYCETHGSNMTGEVTVLQGASISGEDTVGMRNISFNPNQITVAPGTKIVWINREDPGVDAHTVTSGQPSTDGGGGY